MYRIVAAGGVALLAAFALQPTAARADTQIGVEIGESWYPAQYGQGYPAYDSDDDDYDEDDDYGYVSCREGWRIVRDYGFREVRPTRCSGEIYRYEAIKRHRLWSVRVSASSGRIISARVVDDYY